MTITIALAGDTMLGRGVGEVLRRGPSAPILSPEVAGLAADADLFLLNLECCISSRGERWPDPAKPFFFRAPPHAAALLETLGVDAVSLANNHALDYGTDALLDTLVHLEEHRIARAGAGPDEASARRPVHLTCNGLTVAVVTASDHPHAFAAGPDRPGIAYVDIDRPDWFVDTVRSLDDDIVVAFPHWGPNMTTAPSRRIRSLAHRLVDAGATLVTGHSAHVFHGVEGRILYDLGDFVDDYATDPDLRNDLGLLWLVTLDLDGPRRLEAVPLKLDFAHTRLADGEDVRWIENRFVSACAAFGTQAEMENGRLVVDRF